MSYLLVTGIVFIVVPLILIEGFAFFILMNFVRDDPDANNIFKFALGAIGVGVFMIVLYFLIQTFVVS